MAANNHLKNKLPNNTKPWKVNKVLYANYKIIGIWCFGDYLFKLGKERFCIKHAGKSEKYVSFSFRLYDHKRELLLF